MTILLAADHLLDIVTLFHIIFLLPQIPLVILFFHSLFLPSVLQGSPDQCSSSNILLLSFLPTTLNALGSSE